MQENEPKQTNQDESRLMTYDDLSAYLSRKPSALRADVSKRSIPFIKLSKGKRGQIRFRKRDIDAWLDSLLTPAQRKDY